MFKKLLGALGCVLLLSVGATGQANADQPIQFNDSVTFSDVNPCTGELHDVTLNFAVSLHEHRNNFVGHVRRSGSTSDGYTMINGTDSFVENSGVFRGSFVDQWRGPDGEKFRVRGVIVFNANQDQVKTDQFSLTCIGR